MAMANDEDEFLLLARLCRSLIYSYSEQYGIIWQSVPARAGGPTWLHAAPVAARSGDAPMPGTRSRFETKVTCACAVSEAIESRFAAVAVAL